MTTLEKEHVDTENSQKWGGVVYFSCKRDSQSGVKEIVSLVLTTTTMLDNCVGGLPNKSKYRSSRDEHKERATLRKK